MRRLPYSGFFSLGMGVRYVLQAAEGHPLHGPDRLITNIEAILEALPRFELTVSQTLAGEGYGATTLVDLFESMRATEAGALLEEPAATELGRVMRELQNTITVEAKRRYAYVPEARRHSIERLVDDVSALFAPGVFDALPAGVKNDMEEAGRAIAFDLPTAAAFHTMRAIEGEFREFYCRWVRRNRLKTLAWKAMLEQLRGRSTPPPSSVLDQLDSIREHFRNPTQHPDATYDVYEAEELFSNALDIIARMARTTP